MNGNCDCRSIHSPGCVHGQQIQEQDVSKPTSKSEVWVVEEKRRGSWVAGGLVHHSEGDATVYAIDCWHSSRVVRYVPAPAKPKRRRRK